MQYRTAYDRDTVFLVFPRILQDDQKVFLYIQVYIVSTDCTCSFNFNRWVRWIIYL